MNKEDIKNLYDASDSIISWFLGEYMYHYKKEPIEFVDSLKKLNLPKYGAGTLYRWTWLKTEDMKKAKAAKTISIKSGKRSVQSWTDSLKSASTFAEEIGNEPDRRGWTHGIIEAVIPGSKILCFEHDLYDLYKQALKYAKKLYNTDRNDEMKTMFDQIYHTEQTLDDYLYQREWVVRLDNSLVKANDIHIKGWASLKAGAESPDHVIIVIDDPDTGESHIEFPDTNVVPFKREEPLQQAASLKRKTMNFESKLLNASGYLEDDMHEAAAKPEVGDLVEPINSKSNVKYEILEVLENDKVRLRPLEGGLGSFTQNMNTLKVVQPKNPAPVKQPRPSRDPAENLYREEALTRLNYGKYIKKIVDRLEAHAGDIADEVYNQFRPEFEDAMSDVQQDPDVDEQIKIAINDAISDAMTDFNVPSYLEDIVREEALRELHYPGGR